MKIRNLRRTLLSFLPFAPLFLAASQANAQGSIATNSAPSTSSTPNMPMAIEKNELKENEAGWGGIITRVGPGDFAVRVTSQASLASGLMIGGGRGQ